MKKFALLLVLLFALPAQAGVLDDISSNIVLHHDYRAGHAQDLSGNANHGTISGATWVNDGLLFSNTADHVLVADSAELQTTAATFVFLRRRTIEPANLYNLISKRDAGGDNYTIRYSGSGSIAYWSGTAQSRNTSNMIGAACLSIGVTNGQAFNYYEDGLFVGVGPAPSTMTADDAPLYIGNNFANNLVVGEVYNAVMLINRELTATEHAQVCAELVNTTWPTKGQSQAIGTYGPELLIDGDQEAATAAAYSAGNSATLSKQAGNVLAGSLVLRSAHNGTSDPYAYQTILTVGKTYRVAGWARGDATYLPSVQDGSTVLWTGTTSTGWQTYDVSFTATGTELRLYSNASAAGYSEFDNVTVKEAENPQTQYKSDWNTKTITGLTAGYIPDTAWQISSGTWSVTTDTTNGSEIKEINCTSAGIFSLNAVEMQGGPTQNAQGTYRWRISKGAATDPIVYFISDDVAGTTGYNITITNTEIVQLVETGVGALFATAAAYVSDSTYYEFKVTVSNAGVFTAYIDDTIIDVVGGSGTNPVTDTTTTTSYYWVFDLDAGDSIIYSSKAGNYSISKQHGVNP